MIVADTGAIVALIDADDRHHRAMTALFREREQRWILPWAILAEVDYLVATHVGEAAALLFSRDLADGRFDVAWGEEADLVRAHALSNKYRSLKLGLVDAIVMATAERLKATGIATVDEKHFGAVELRGKPRILPRDR